MCLIGWNARNGCDRVRAVRSDAACPVFRLKILFGVRGICLILLDEFASGLPGADSVVCYDVGVDGFRSYAFDAPEFPGQSVDLVRRRIDDDADDVHVPFAVGQAHAAHDVRPEIVQERVDLLGGVETFRQDRQYGHTSFHCDSVPLVQVYDDFII